MFGLPLPALVCGLSLCLTLGSAASLCAQAVAPPASPDRVLTHKGLVREGLSYLLTDQGERERRVIELRQNWASVDAEARPLELRYAQLKRERDFPPRSGIAPGDETKAEGAARAREERAAAAVALMVFENNEGLRLVALKKEREELRSLGNRAVAGTLKIYMSFWEDPEVRTALWTINQTARPPVVLGPYASQAEYVSMRRFAAAKHLTDRGLIYDVRSATLFIPTEVEAVGHLAEVTRRRVILADAETKENSAAAAKADLPRRRKALSDQLPSATPQRARLLSLQIQVIDDQLRRVPDRTGSDPTFAAEKAARMSRLRELYVDAVENLRAAVDAVPKQRQKVEANPEVTTILAELRGELKSPIRVAVHPEFKHALTALADAEKGIQSERIVLEPGAKAGEPLKARVTLNGTAPLAMVVDTWADFTRLPEPVADRLSLERGAVAEIPLPNGGTVTARRATLKSVRLGALIAEDVECLVVPADAPAALGASFLNRFACRIQDDGRLIRIARVAPQGVPVRTDRHFTTKPPS